MMKTIKQLLVKYKTEILYLCFGVATTLINVLCYYVLNGLLLVPNVVSTVIAWIVSVLFAFFTNRKWVFTEADKSKGSFGRQLVLFAGSRVASFLLDLAVTYGCTLLLALWITTPPIVLGIAFTPGVIAKLIAAVLVIIANYVLSKLIVFTKKKN